MQATTAGRNRGLAAWRDIMQVAVVLLCAACSGTSASPGAPSGTTGRPPAATADTAAAAPAGSATDVAQPRERVRLAYSSIAGVTAVPVIARDRGLFAQNGLDAELTYVASGTTAIQSLLSGELTFVLGGTEAILNADAAGGNLEIIAGLVDTVPFSLLVRPDITQAEQLRGKRLGVTRLGSATDYAMRAALRRWGLDPERDTTIVQLGGIPEIRAGLESGAIEGGTLSLPVLAQARRDGFRELADLAALDIDYETTSVAATAKTLAERRPAAEALVRALSQAIYVMRTDKAVAMATFRDLIQENDEQILEETYDRYALTYIQRLPEPAPRAIGAVKDQMAVSDPRVASLRLEDVIDATIVQGLEAAGFYSRLYGESPEVTGTPRAPTSR